MKIRNIIYTLLIAAIQLSCQDSSSVVDSGRVAATVGEKSLSLGEVLSATPSKLSGEDSVAFMKRYVERWIERQIKVTEAELIFPSSALEIEAMVSAYRDALMTRKLDQYYIDSSKDTPYTEEDIESYYRQNQHNFRLGEAIVKGSILRVPIDNSNTSKLLTLMRSSSKDSRADLISLSEKFKDLELEEYTSEWINYSDFIAMLPMVRSSGSDLYLKQKGVQSLKDDSHTYLFEITEYRAEGAIAPMERVRDNIVRVLTNEHYAMIIKREEAKLYNRAVRSKEINNYIDIDQSEYVEKGYFSTIYDKIKTQ